MSGNPERGGPRTAALRRASGYAPALVYALFLLWLGSRSDVPSPGVRLPLDKLAHFVLYGVLGWLAAVGWLKSGQWPAAALVVTAAALCGAVDEIHQRSVPGRSAELADWVVDVVAVVVAFQAARRRGVPTGKDA